MVKYHAYSIQRQLSLNTVKNKLNFKKLLIKFISSLLCTSCIAIFQVNLD